MIGAWKTATVAKDGTESGEVDLGRDFEKVLVIIPTIDSATVTVEIVKDEGGTAYDMNQLDADATGSFASATTAGTGGIACIFPCGAQFIKILCGAAQTTAARTFYVRGL